MKTEATAKLEREIMELEDQKEQCEEIITDLRAELNAAESERHEYELQALAYKKQMEEGDLAKSKEISEKDEKILFIQEKLDTIEQDHNMEKLRLSQTVRRLEMELNDSGRDDSTSSKS